ncbi:hypothetical protein EVA_15122 [gut metagenome]|uniref:Uncharacterized protein n=1 Tax=gut metagenome TaxID=749906 RepID=J9FPA5_9ZZZZ
MANASIAYTWQPMSKNATPKVRHAIEHSPEASPSIPSIRFMALIMNTVIRIVRGQPIHSGMSLTPNTP